MTSRRLAVPPMTSFSGFRRSSPACGWSRRMGAPAQVVVGADAGQHRDLLPAQARHAPSPQNGDADLFRGDELAAGAHVISEQVRFGGHASTRIRDGAHVPGPATSKNAGALAAVTVAA